MCSLLALPGDLSYGRNVWVSSQAHLTIALALLPCLAEAGTAISGADAEGVHGGQIGTAGARAVGKGVSMLTGMQNSSFQRVVYVLVYFSLRPTEAVIHVGSGMDVLVIGAGRSSMSCRVRWGSGKLEAYAGAACYNTSAPSCGVLECIQFIVSDTISKIGLHAYTEVENSPHPMPSSCCLSFFGSCASWTRERNGPCHYKTFRLADL